MPKKPGNPIDKHVGQRVRQARLLINISQTDVGNELGLTFQQVQKYENGTNRISASKLYAISGIVGRPVAWFFEGLPDQGNLLGPQPDDPVQILANTRQGVELARAFIEIESAQMRDAILLMAMAAAAGPVAKRKAA